MNVPMRRTERMDLTAAVTPTGSRASEGGGADWIAALRAYLVAIAGGNLLWEAAHLPLYTLWETGTRQEKLFAVLHCTGGDLLIALTVLILALVLAGDREWPASGTVRVGVLTVLLGVGYTVFSEWLNIVVRASWAYSDRMPVVPVFGMEVGLSPLLQWLVVPLIALGWAWWCGDRQRFAAA
jgi:hypothetical protein